MVTEMRRRAAVRQSPRQSPRRARWPREYPWCDGLPPTWREQVVVPLDFDIHRDHELAAQRVFGRDEDGAPCYYAHRWTISEPCSDDDEEFYLRPSAGESVTAWRLRDERWLVRRVVLGNGNGNDRCAAAQPFFVFSESMPR